MKHLNRALTRLKGRTGASLAEMLLATLMVLLVATGLTAGVRLAQQQYIRSMQYSEAQELSGTLETILTNELRYTTIVVLNGSKVEQFYSVTYAIHSAPTALVSLDADGEECEYGELALGHDSEYNRILGSAAYPNHLKAKGRITYADGYFTVKLTIAANTEPLLTREFQVRALNALSITTA